MKVRGLQLFYLDLVHQNILGMSIDKKFHVDIRGGHIELFLWVRKVLTAPAPNYVSENEAENSEG
jgi:hypothetical protein